MSGETCFHCGLPADPRGRFRAEIDGEVRPFCCAGCEAVARTIAGSGLARYYRLRTAAALPAVDNATTADFRIYDRPAFQRGFIEHGNGTETATLNIDGITCAACTWLIEKQLAHTPGVTAAQVNLGRHRATIEYDPGQVQPSRLFETIERLGYHPSPYSESGEEALLEREHKRALQRLGIAGIGMMQVVMYAVGLHAGALEGISENFRDLLRLSSMVVATAVVFYAAQPFFQGAWRDLRNRAPGMDVPVALAIGIAYAASCWATVAGHGDVYFDSLTMFTFFLLAGRYLEMRARHRSARTAAGIESALPPYAWRRRDDGVVEQVPLDALVSGDYIAIRPGELVPADATVSEGASSVDESAFTGEYRPVSKTVGDPLSAGSVNGDGSLLATVSAVGEQSRLAAVRRLLERAQSEKPAIARLADRAARWFVTGVLLISAAVAVAWYTFDPQRALWVVLSVLVVSCPCALSLATPTAVTAALGGLRRRGILVSRGHVLETTAQLDTIVFDKTGTLTRGRVAVIAAHCFDAIDETASRAIAAALERYSSHPIAAAFTASPAIPDASAVRVHAGAGVEGVIAGQSYRIGHAAFARELAGSAPPSIDAGDRMQVWLATDGRWLALFELDDRIRDDAAGVIARLAGRFGLVPVLLSGDASHAVEATAGALGIVCYERGLTPQAKLDYLAALQRDGHRVAMVGDGINDVPVLARADVSIAVTNATDLAKSSADVLLLTGSLGGLEELADAARHTRAVVHQNLWWAAAYNAVAIPLAAAGLVPPWLAAIGMSASSIAVVGNAMRLGRSRPQVPAIATEPAYE